MELIILVMITVIIGQGTTISICERRSEQLYRLPELMSCDAKNYKKWKVEVYKQNLKQYKSSIKSLRIILRICTTDTSFWNVKTKDLKTLNYEVDQNTARSMMNQHSCLKADGSRTINTLINDFECQYKWLSSVETRTFSCYYEKGSIIATHSGYLSTAIGSLNGCNYNDTFCHSHGAKYYMWNRVIGVDSEYLKVGDYNATSIGEHLIISELAMTFRKPISANLNMNICSL